MVAKTLTSIICNGFFINLITSQKIYFMPVVANTIRKTFVNNANFPSPGSMEERAAFKLLEIDFLEQFDTIFPDKLAPRTVVILPSLSLDLEILSKIKGASYYEERLLCLLMLLRMPLTKVIYLTSMPVADSIVDYYLHLLPGISNGHARQRLTLLSCYDGSVKPLTQKVLERPRLMEKIRQLIPDVRSAHLTCYNITDLEKTMAVQLGIPLFGTNPDKFYEGSKSGGRKNFRDSGVHFPDGFEDLHTKEDIVQSLAALKRKYPQMRKAVVKMNDGFSGDGNAMYSYPLSVANNLLEQSISDSLHDHLKPVSKDVSLDLFLEKFASMGGIVEEFVDGEVKVSPSVQCVISPSKQIVIVSTHDQVLGGDDGQIFVGAIFPADKSYSVLLAEEGRKIAQTLAERGAIGRFALDFISVKQQDDSWLHYAIEINLRKGGTTHPFLMLQFLTDGKYIAETGEYITAAGYKRYYFASDNVCSDKYIGLTPEDLMQISIFHNLMYDGATQEGVMFHMIGALSEFGKLGVVCIGNSPENARAYYDKTLEILDLECT